MNAQQIAAYEALCAKVPGAKHPHCTRKYYGCWSLGDGDSGPIEDADALAILTDHLERMLPPESILYWPDCLKRGYEYAVMTCPDLFADPDRFIALCKAVEASR